MEAKRKTVMITGATSGIGFQLAQDYIDEGYHVIACGRNEEKLQQLQKLDPKATILSFNISNKEEIHDKLSTLEFIPDLIILNAGVCEYINDGQIDSDLIERVHKVNFFAPVWIIEFFQKKDPLLNTHIAVVSSSATFIPFPRSEAYGSSKAALTYFINSLSTEKLNSKLTVINPGFVKTELTDKNDFNMPFLVDVDDASKFIIRKLKSSPQEISFPWKFMFILKLIRMLPIDLQIKFTKKLSKN
ncbi:short-chain dehydrogenase [Paraphotobacterium marinum]|uniref:Short-chain dehydrogenase n=1 Tax=Paraphotobacterium marinum TaxID=1755811 RepID=A0A220VGT5_9GAMM|nr:SDR family NAD(P)-dependent oxidoreductase [Paraphotobacterium marinum]ASK79575.1 short-chain dehydrogenase [Paraphotobacterium marinum]